MATLLLAWGLPACGGHFAPTPDNAAGGPSGVDPDSGLRARDATVLIDGNGTRCPSTAPAPYSDSASDRFIWDSRDGEGCTRRFMCVTQGSVVATGVGGAYPPGGSTVWIAQSPMAGDACSTPGK